MQACPAATQHLQCPEVENIGLGTLGSLSSPHPTPSSPGLCSGLQTLGARRAGWGQAAEGARLLRAICQSALLAHHLVPGVAGPQQEREDGPQPQQGPGPLRPSTDPCSGLWAICRPGN